MTERNVLHTFDTYDTTNNRIDCDDVLRKAEAAGIDAVLLSVRPINGGNKDILFVREGTPAYKYACEASGSRGLWQVDREKPWCRAYNVERSAHYIREGREKRRRRSDEIDEADEDFAW